MTMVVAMLWSLIEIGHCSMGSSWPARSSAESTTTEGPPSLQVETLCIRIQRVRAPPLLAIAMVNCETSNAKQPRPWNQIAFPPSPHICASCVVAPLTHIPFISLAFPVPATVASQPVNNILPFPCYPSTRCPVALSCVPRVSGPRFTARVGGERHLARNPMPRHPALALPYHATPFQGANARASFPCSLVFYSALLT
ncbi:hypothetical protein JOL62DRAFT_43695 [Phyllosticta paracitricarpa]|uniref:Secreted protein n=1 Tax=Phyllosticta paracitricarpa TaxID=2016321 RepID=A0ABR1NCI4_9PEZI